MKYNGNIKRIAAATGKSFHTPVLARAALVSFEVLRDLWGIERLRAREQVTTSLARA